MKLALKKIFFILLASFLLTAFFGCSSDTDDSSSQDTENPSISEPSTPENPATPSNPSEPASPTPTYGGYYAPKTFTVEADPKTTNGITITWEAEEEPHYWIYYSTENNAEKAEILTKYTYGGKYSTTLSATGTYYFWIRAFQYYGTDGSLSSFSDAVSYDFTFTALSAPTNFKVVGSSTTLNTLDLTWDAVDGVNYYWIFYSTEKDSSTAKYGWVASYSNKKSITIPESGEYHFWVKSASGYYSETSTPSCSDFSEMWYFNFTHKDLSVPTNLKAEKFESGNSKGIKLSWDASSPASAYYHIYWAEENDSTKAEFIGYETINASIRSEILYNFKTGTTYYFWVKSADGEYKTDNATDFSNVASITYN